MQLLSLPSCQSPPVLTPSPSRPCEGGAEEACGTRYCEWYNGLCIWSCYCLGCGEVIQWHFNRLSAFFAVALVLICRIKTQPVRHWTCCLAVEQREYANRENGGAHFPAYTGRDVLISDKPRFPVWRHQSSDERMVCYCNTPSCLWRDTVGFYQRGKNRSSLSLLCHRYLVFRHKIYVHLLFLK